VSSKIEIGKKRKAGCRGVCVISITTSRGITESSRFTSAVPMAETPKIVRGR
jgi:hypothetical protein